MNEISLAEYRQQIVDTIDDGRYVEAVAHGNHILQHYPKDVHAYWLLGRALFEADSDQHAYDMFRRVLSVDPDRMLAWVGLSELAERQGNLEAAIGHLERAFELATDNDGIASHLRQLYGELEGREPKRLQLTGGALARLYLRGDLLSRAIAELQGLLEEDPDRVDLQMALAEALWRSRDRLQASQVCREILEVQPFNLTANLILGEILTRDGRAEGNRYLERAEELDPENEAAQELFGPNSPLPPKDPQITPADYGAIAGPGDLAEIELLPRESESKLIPPDEALTRRLEVPLWLEGIAGDPASERSGGTGAPVSEIVAEEPLAAEDVDDDAIAREMGIADPPVEDAMEDGGPSSGSKAKFEHQARSVPDDLTQETAQRLPDQVEEAITAGTPEESVTTAEDDAEAFDEWSSAPEESDSREAEGSDDLAPADIPDWLQGLVPVEQAPRGVPGTDALTALLDEETIEEEASLRDESDDTEDLMALLEAEGMTSDRDVLHWLEQLVDEEEADLSLPATEREPGRVPGTTTDSEVPTDEDDLAPEATPDGLQQAGDHVLESPALSTKPPEAVQTTQSEQEHPSTAHPDWLDPEIPRDTEEGPTRSDIGDADVVAQLEEWGVGDDLPGWLDIEELPYGSDVLAWLEQLSEDVERELRRKVDAAPEPPVDAFVEQPEPTADTVVPDVDDEPGVDLDAETEPQVEEVVEEPEPALDATVADLEEESRGELEAPSEPPLDQFVDQPEPTPDTVVPDVDDELGEELEAETEPRVEKIVEEPEPTLDPAVADLEEQLIGESEAPSEPPLDQFVDQPEPAADTVVPDVDDELGEELEAETEPRVEEIVEEPEPTLDPAVADLEEELRGESEAPSEPPLDELVDQPEATTDAVIADVDEEVWEELKTEIEAPVDKFADQPEPTAETAVADLDEQLQEEEEAEAEIKSRAEEIVEEPSPSLDRTPADIEQVTPDEADQPSAEPTDTRATQQAARAGVERPAEQLGAAAELARIDARPKVNEEPVEDLRGRIADRRTHLEAHLEDDRARLELGRLLWQAEDRDKAIEAYDTLIQHGEPLDEIISDLEEYSEQWHDPWLKRALGDAYFRADRLGDALDVYRQALADL